MKKSAFLLTIVLFSGLFSCLLADNMNWWREARFGMFIHWGLYAIPAGEWNGEAKYAEWIRDRAEIPLDTYDRFVAQFNPFSFDADKWVQIAKKAGMKYIVLTSKHHDGFCLFDSQFTDFDIMSTPFKRDILRELVTAASKEGIHIGCYYSIMDWHHPDYLPRRPWEEAERSAQGADFDRYIKYMKNQLKELITNYPDIEILWFDGGWESTWTQAYGNDLYAYVKSLKPAIIINNRASKNLSGISGLMENGGYGGDFGTPEQEIPSIGLAGVDWETCMTLNDNWGFKKSDNNWKSTRQLIHHLADIASKGGNFLLNVGPMADGLIPGASTARLDSIGAWMNLYSESIYGTQTSPFEELDWGRCTQKTIYEGTRLYLHVFDWPGNGKLVLPGIMNRAKKAYLLSDPHQLLKVNRLNDALVIDVQAKAADEMNTVIILDIDGRPDVVKPPVVKASAPIFLEKVNVSVAAVDNMSTIRYTLDGSEPALQSPLYKEQLLLTQTTTVSARSFRDDQPVSKAAMTTVKKVTPSPALAVTVNRPGLTYKYYEGIWERVPAFENLEPVKSGQIPTINLSPKMKKTFFGFTFNGYVKIPATAVYIISIASNDGSLLYLDNTLLINNDEDHPLKEEHAFVALQEGWHAIKVAYFQTGASADLKVHIQGPNLEKQEIPAEMYGSE
jgi:alpha-L-fucosidase